jgi:hypothetical protein
MKKIGILVTLLLVVGIAFFTWHKAQAPALSVSNTSEQTVSTNSVATSVPEIISADKPTSFEGVEMTTYKNPDGYEITYPKNWFEFNLPDTYGDQRIVTAHHYISPSKINSELEGLLLKPMGCEDGGCQKYFSKFVPIDYSLMDIYVKKFDSRSELNSVEFQNAQKTELVLESGVHAVMWTFNYKNIDTRKILIDGIDPRVRYEISIREPKNYKLDFDTDIMSIINTFKITN